MVSVVRFICTGLLKCMIAWIGTEFSIAACVCMKILTVQIIFNDVLKDILQPPQGTPTERMLTENEFKPFNPLKKKYNQLKDKSKKIETQVNHKITCKNSVI